MARKTTVRIHQALNEQDCTRETLDMVKKWKPQKKNWISLNRTNYIIKKIDKMQQVKQLIN